MQYHPGSGTSRLTSELLRVQRELHGEGEFGVCCTCGNTDALVKTLELLTEPGDTVLVEAYTWPGFLSMLGPRRRRAVGVAIDERGALPRALDAALATLEQEEGPKQRLFYTIPTGHNPTGMTVDLERKKQLYDVCRRRGVVVLEDDPYYFLEFNDPSASFLSLDTDGRVVRLDSAAKIVAPGLRLGWASASPAFVEKYRLFSEGSTQFPSGLSQTALLHLLTDRDKWTAHLRHVVDDYRRRRDLLADALAAELDPALATFQLPASGMFFWLKQLVTPDAADLQDDFVDAGVAVVPGRCFRSTFGADKARDADTSVDPCPYLRLTFAFGQDHHIRTGVRRVAQVLKRRANA
uniref:Aminotransferase class I/classII large domain-containing protein n=1 Tax=Chrysocystis fragilis TaxID=1411660 RepID=A0A7S0XMB2_9STRA|mmetsp:Transcript_851/g.2481  ORF Transcript_851/g.2481 Transcript_851/m.2481 type:complete len:351 (+) Transcript_851:402-1454(+)